MISTPSTFVADVGATSVSVVDHWDSMIVYPYFPSSPLEEPYSEFYGEISHPPGLPIPPLLISPTPSNSNGYPTTCPGAPRLGSKSRTSRSPQRSRSQQQPTSRTLHDSTDYNRTAVGLGLGIPLAQERIRRNSSLHSDRAVTSTSDCSYSSSTISNTSFGASFASNSSLKEGSTTSSHVFDSFEYINRDKFPKVPHLVFPTPQRHSCSCASPDQTTRRELLDGAIRDVLAVFGVQSTDVLSSESTAPGAPRIDDEDEGGYVELRNSESWNSWMSFEDIDVVEGETGENGEMRFGEGDSAVSMTIFGSK